MNREAGHRLDIYKWSSTDVLVEVRPLRRFFCIASGRLFGPVRSCRRSFDILDAIDPTLRTTALRERRPFRLIRCPVRRTARVCEEWQRPMRGRPGGHL